MATRKKSFADSFTVESLQRGSDTGPISNGGMTGSGAVKGSGKGYKGAPTLYSIDRGEKVVQANPGSGNIYPPTYGGVEPQTTVTKKQGRSLGQNGYKPSSGDQSSAPNSN